MKVTIVGRKANVAKKDGRFIIDAVKEDGRHILVGILGTEPKKGDTFEIFGDSFKLPQDAIWADKAELVAAVPV